MYEDLEATVSCTVDGSDVNWIQFVEEADEIWQAVSAELSQMLLEWSTRYGSTRNMSTITREITGPQTWFFGPKKGEPAKPGSRKGNKCAEEDPVIQSVSSKIREKPNTAITPPLNQSALAVRNTEVELCNPLTLLISIRGSSGQQHDSAKPGRWKRIKTAEKGRSPAPPTPYRRTGHWLSLLQTSLQP